MPKATDADKDRFRSLVPEQPDPKLKLGVDPGRLVLRITPQGGSIRTYRPDWHFLARWWVNGKPTAAIAISYSNESPSRR